MPYSGRRLQRPRMRTPANTASGSRVTGTGSNAHKISSARWRRGASDKGRISATGLPCLSTVAVCPVSITRRTMLFACLLISAMLTFMRNPIPMPKRERSPKIVTRYVTLDRAEPSLHGLDHNALRRARDPAPQPPNEAATTTPTSAAKATRVGTYTNTYLRVWRVRATMR